MIRLLSVVAAATLVVGACGGARAPAPAPPVRAATAPAGSGSAVAHADAHAPDDHPGEAECDALIAHVLALELAERPADQQLAEAERAPLREQLRAQNMAGCLELSRDSYRCILAATQTAALRSCR